MLKVIFFDFDGVLTTDFNGTGTICNNVCKVLPGLSIEKITECYRTHFGHLQIGDGNYGDSLAAFNRCIGAQVSRDIFDEALRTVPKNEPMFAVIEQLRKRYRLGIITDNATERMALLNEAMRLPEIFDPIIVSATVRASKTDGTTAIFDAALEAAACEASESGFIDNQERNLVTPARMGMKTYWHDDAKNDVSLLVSVLREWGVVLEKIP